MLSRDRSLRPDVSATTRFQYQAYDLILFTAQRPSRLEHITNASCGIEDCTILCEDFSDLCDSKGQRLRAGDFSIRTRQPNPSELRAGSADAVPDVRRQMEASPKRRSADSGRT